MSANFDDMASKAKAAHEARIAKQDRQDAAQRDDKGRIVEAAIAALTADVLRFLKRQRRHFVKMESRPRSLRILK